MKFLLLFPSFLASLIMAAHLFRFGWHIAAFALLIVPLALLIRQRWIPWIFQLLLVLAAGEWLHITYVLAQQRMYFQQPWLRMALILGAVALFNLIAAALFWTRALRAHYGLGVKGKKE